MPSLRSEIAEFALRSAAQTTKARAIIALRLLLGEDLEMALDAGSEEKLRLARRIVLRLERERQKGLRSHWSYDLNRHISLRQALDILTADSACRRAAPTR